MPFLWPSSLKAAVLGQPLVDLAGLGLSPVEYAVTCQHCKVSHLLRLMVILSVI